MVTQTRPDAGGRPLARKGDSSSVGPVLNPAPYTGPRATRKRELILSTARQLFLEKGFGATVMEDVSDAAGISRASVYTYFPSKFALFAELGIVAYRSVEDVIEELATVPQQWTLTDLEGWVSRFLAEFDTHRGFITQWAEASAGDENVRAAWRKNELRLAAQLGGELARLQGRGEGDHTQQGLVVLGMLSHVWELWRVAGAPFSEVSVKTTLTAALAAHLRAFDPTEP